MPNTSYLANAAYDAVSSAAHWTSCSLCQHPVACAAHEAPVSVSLFSASEPAASTAGDDYFTYDAWADPERLPVLEHGRVSAEELRVGEQELAKQESGNGGTDSEDHENREGEQQNQEKGGGGETLGVEPGYNEWGTDEEIEAAIRLEIEENQLVLPPPNTLRMLRELEVRGAQRHVELDHRTEKGKGSRWIFYDSDSESEPEPEPSEDEDEKWERRARGIDPDTLFRMTRPSATFEQGESSTTAARRKLSAAEQWDIKVAREEFDLQLDMQLAIQASIRDMIAEPQTPVPDTPLITPTAMQPTQDQEQTQRQPPEVDGAVSGEDTGDISSINLDSPDKSSPDSKNSSELQSIPEQESLSSSDFLSSPSISDPRGTKAIDSETKLSTEYAAKQTSQVSVGSLDTPRTTRKDTLTEDGNTPAVKKSDGQLGLSRRPTPIPQRVNPLNLSLDTNVLSTRGRQHLKDGKLTPANGPVVCGKMNDIPAEVEKSTAVREGGALDGPLPGSVTDVLLIEVGLDSLRSVEDRGRSQVARPFRHTDEEERERGKEKQHEQEQNDKRPHSQDDFSPEQTQQAALTPAPKQKYKSLLPPIEDDPGLEGEHDPFNQDDPITKSNTELNRGNFSGANRRPPLGSGAPRNWRWIKKTKRGVRFKKEEMPPSALQLKSQETLTDKVTRTFSSFTGSRNTTGGLNRGQGTLESSREFMRRSLKEKHHREVLKRHQRALHKQMDLGNLDKEEILTKMQKNDPSESSSDSEDSLASNRTSAPITERHQRVDLGNLDKEEIITKMQNNDPSESSSDSEGSLVSNRTSESITGEPSKASSPTAPESTTEDTAGERLNPHLSTTPESSPRASTGEAPAQFSSVDKHTLASNAQDKLKVPPSEKHVQPVDPVGSHSSNLEKKISTESDPDRITPVSEHKTSPAPSVKSQGQKTENEERVATKDEQKTENEEVDAAKDEQKLNVKDKKKARVPNALKPWKWGRKMCDDPASRSASTSDRIERWWTKRISRRG